MSAASPGNEFAPQIFREAILIQSLHLITRIGVPDEERVTPQKLLLDLAIQPLGGFAEMQDNLAHTVNYAQLAEELGELAGSRPRKLLETLAEEIADWVLTHHPARAIFLRIRKFILPQTEFVGVSLYRERPSDR